MLAEWRRWVARVVIAIVLLHLLRPELDLVQFDPAKPTSPRMNIAGSRWYLPGGWDVRRYADLGRKFVIVEQTGNAFVLQVYGKGLGNEVIGTVDEKLIGPRCSGLAFWALTQPKALYIDDMDKTKDCRRTCAATGPYGCAAWRIHVL